MPQNKTTARSVQLGSDDLVLSRAYANHGLDRERLEVDFFANCSSGNLHAVLRVFRVCALIVVIVSLAESGCATEHATLQFRAPSAVTAGAPFSITVTVLYKGKPDTVINNHIHFTSSDPAAVLPGDYYFVPADAGSHTWINGFTLSTSGNQRISGAIHDATGINGSADVIVSP